MLRMEYRGIRKSHHRPERPLWCTLLTLTDTDLPPQTMTAHGLHAVTRSCYYKYGSSRSNKSIHCSTAQVHRSSARCLPLSFTLYGFPEWLYCLLLSHILLRRGQGSVSHPVILSHGKGQTNTYQNYMSNVTYIGHSRGLITRFSLTTPWPLEQCWW